MVFGQSGPTEASAPTTARQRGSPPHFPLLPPHCIPFAGDKRTLMVLFTAHCSPRRGGPSPCQSLALNLFPFPLSTFLFPLFPFYFLLRPDSGNLTDCLPPGGNLCYSRSKGTWPIIDRGTFFEDGYNDTANI